ncbi:MAG: aromatic amino acid DMT transporter YddG [Methylobacillus glycogenes]|nr:aromatic amino acid DMT transporter YddG [Methylobacillus glycogenes]
MKTRTQSTLIGLLAIVLWSAIVGLIRGVAEHFGATGGAALIYTLASILLWLSVGLGNLRTFPRLYLLWGSVLFVCYELCLALSIGWAHSHQQAIEVGMVNYLWPAFTMLCAIVFNGQRANWLIVPGLMVSLTGIGYVLAGDAGLQLAGMVENIADNPSSYGLALLGAVLWAAYCTLTARIAKGSNGITLFFMLSAAVFWLQYFAWGASPLVFDAPALLKLGLAAAAMGLGYAAWNVGILHGNMTILAGASYFTPVLSAALAACMLHTSLTLTFWQGVAMVSAGSILCWLSTRKI